jgi:hypothetical protein
MEDLNESRVISPVQTPILESIGPPKILKYLPESKKIQLIPPAPEDRISDGSNESIHQFFKEFNIYLKGGNPCEFCSQNTQKWPEIKQQETEQPNTV